MSTAHAARTQPPSGPAPSGAGPGAGAGASASTAASAVVVEADERLRDLQRKRSNSRSSVTPGALGAAPADLVSPRRPRPPSITARSSTQLRRALLQKLNISAQAQLVRRHSAAGRLNRMGLLGDEAIETKLEPGEDAARRARRARAAHRRQRSAGGMGVDPVVSVEELHPGGGSTSLAHEGGHVVDATRTIVATEPQQADSGAGEAGSQQPVASAAGTATTTAGAGKRPVRRFGFGGGKPSTRAASPSTQHRQRPAAIISGEDSGEDSASSPRKAPSSRAATTPAGAALAARDDPTGAADADAQAERRRAAAAERRRLRPRAASEVVDRRRSPAVTFDPRAVQRNLLSRGRQDFRRNLIHRIRHETGAGRGAPAVSAARFRQPPAAAPAAGSSAAPADTIVDAVADASPVVGASGGSDTEAPIGSDAPTSTPSRARIDLSIATDAPITPGGDVEPASPVGDAAPPAANAPRTFPGGVVPYSDKWVPSRMVSACHLCATKFTLTNRKHHCRGCGQVVCNRCSPYRMHVESVGSVARICYVCFHSCAGEVWDTKRPDTMLFISAAERGDALAVEARLSNGQDPNTYERSSGITALHMAAANGHAEVIRVLLKHRAKVNQATYDGRTALHFAAQNNAADSIPPLLRADANMRAVSRNGETVKVAAMLAGSEAFLARMKVALAATPRGADAKRRPEKGQVTALQPANPEAHYQELEVLEPAGQALQLNLLGVRDEEVRVVEERRWTHDVLELGMRSKFEELGLLEPAYRTRPMDEECEIIGQTWVIGHLFGADVDIGDAVDQVVRGLKDMAEGRLVSSVAYDDDEYDDRDAMHGADQELDESDTSDPLPHSRS